MFVEKNCAEQTDGSGVYAAPVSLSLSKKLLCTNYIEKQTGEAGVVNLPPLFSVYHWTRWK